MALKLFWAGFVLFNIFSEFGLSNPDGFLSLSCGGTSNVDPYNISWVSDSEYISTGNTTTVNYMDGGTSPTAVPIRFFPNSYGRNCYKLPVKNNSPSVTIRAKFVYKNYNGMSKPPSFHVSLGTVLVGKINLGDKDPWIEEIVWRRVNKDLVSFCLHSIKGRGIPVISSLEIRPLPVGAYSNGLEDLQSKLHRKSYRLNCGYTNASIRYPLDQFDRIWDSDHNFAPFHASAGFDILQSFNHLNLTEDPPVSVLQSARVLARKENLTYSLPLDKFGDYYIILYFAGILPLSPSFDVITNGEIQQPEYTVTRSEATALYFKRRGIKNLNITFKKIGFNPQVNAIEVYEILDIPPTASSTTVSALQVIEQSTGLDLGWQDDPCSPFPWDRIGCEGSLVTSLVLSDIKLRSISPTLGDLLDLKALDMHNASLTGAIQNLGSLQHLEKLNLSFNQLTSFGSELEDMISLQVLDLQNNSLQGVVPENLGELDNLHLLNLENNKLQGTLPQSLNRDSLDVRTMGNLCLSFSTLSCNVSSSMETPRVTVFPIKKHREHSHLSIIVGPVAAASFFIILISVFVFIYTKKRRNKETYSTRVQLDMRNWNKVRIFSYREIKTATNNFKEVIGRGSFGCVYLGKLSDGTQVAVKMRFDRTQLGADSFVNEVHLLSQIQHQNLVSLVGFCHEPKHQTLVYEYLSGGSLADHLYGNKRFSLSWVRRLKIAVDAAKGLDYLHNGSEPRIIHRDIKCSNILLDEDMNAKVSDFGLSKELKQSDATHITTAVKGSVGYLDPEYYSTQQLTEKSDVYSFGVVLLELICGREPLTHSGSPDSFNLVLWAKPYLQAGAFEVADDSLRGTFDAESMKKAALVAVKCVERDASDRPNISQVLAELKEAYSVQVSYLAAAGHTDLPHSLPPIYTA